MLYFDDEQQKRTNLLDAIRSTTNKTRQTIFNEWFYWLKKETSIDTSFRPPNSVYFRKNIKFDDWQFSHFVNERCYSL